MKKEGALSLLSGLEQRQTVNKTKQFPSTKAEREQSIIGPQESAREAEKEAEREAEPGLKMGRKPWFVAEAPTSVCCSKERKKKIVRADLNISNL